MTISNWIKENREFFGYTQAQLGELIGCSQQGIQHYESGKRIPDYEKLSQLSQIFCSEIKIGANGIEIIPTSEGLLKKLQLMQNSFEQISVLQNSVELTRIAVEDSRTNTHPYVKGFCAEEFETYFKNQTLKLTESKDLTTIRNQIGFQFGEQVLHLDDFKSLANDELQLKLLGEEIEALTNEQIEKHGDSSEMFDPFELSGLGRYSCNLMVGDEGLEGSISLSLFREELSDNDDKPYWFWHFYSEIEGHVEQITDYLCVEKSTGEEAYRLFVEMLESFLTLTEVKTMIKNHYQHKTIL